MPLPSTPCDRSAIALSCTHRASAPSPRARSSACSSIAAYSRIASSAGASIWASLLYAQALALPAPSAGSAGGSVLVPLGMTRPLVDLGSHKDADSPLNSHGEAVTSSGMNKPIASRDDRPSAKAAAARLAEATPEASAETAPRAAWRARRLANSAIPSSPITRTSCGVFCSTSCTESAAAVGMSTKSVAMAARHALSSSARCHAAMRVVAHTDRTSEYLKKTTRRRGRDGVGGADGGGTGGTDCDCGIGCDDGDTLSR